MVRVNPEVLNEVKELINTDELRTKLNHIVVAGSETTSLVKWLISAVISTLNKLLSKNWNAQIKALFGANKANLAKEQA